MVGPRIWHKMSFRFLYYQNTIFASLNLVSGLNWVQTGLNPLWTLRWHADYAFDVWGPQVSCLSSPLPNPHQSRASRRKSLAGGQSGRTGALPAAWGGAPVVPTPAALVCACSAARDGTRLAGHTHSQAEQGRCTAVVIPAAGWYAPASVRQGGRESWRSFRYRGGQVGPEGGRPRRDAAVSVTASTQ